MRLNGISCGLDCIAWLVRWIHSHLCHSFHHETRSQLVDDERNSKPREKQEGDGSFVRGGAIPSRVAKTELDDDEQNDESSVNLQHKSQYRGGSFRKDWFSNHEIDDEGNRTKKDDRGDAQNEA